MGKENMEVSSEGARAVETPKSPSEFVWQAIEETSKPIARYSVSTSPDASLNLPELTKGDRQVAEFLADMSVMDPLITEELRNINLFEPPTPEKASIASQVLLAKAEAVKDLNPSKDQKKALDDFTKKAKDVLGEYIWGKGRKKAVSAVVLGSMLLAACGPIGSVNAFPVEPTPATSAIPSAEAEIPGAEATQDAEQRSGESVAISSQESLDLFFEQADLGEVDKELVQPFGVKVGETVFDFVLIPQPLDENGEVLADERLAIRVGDTWTFLNRRIRPGTDGQNYVLWAYNSQGEVETLSDSLLEPTLWYRAIEENINAIGFVPPMELAEKMNFDLPGDYVILIPYEGFPENVKRVLAREAEPISEVTQNLLEEFRETGREIIVEANTVYELIDGERMKMFEARGATIAFDVLGLTEPVSVEAGRLTTRTVGGYEKLYVERDEEGQGFMWRTPWGEWVEDRDKIFTENGVSIIANEAELYGGLFTINTERAEELWEGFVGGIYQVNVATRNTALLSRYPTRESFLQAARSGIEISNVRIPIRYPDRQNPRFQYDASWEQVGAVNLSSAVLRIPQFSREENVSYIAYNSDYIQYIRNDLNFLVEAMSTEGDVFTLFFAVKSQRLIDEYGLLNLSEDKTKEENFAAATQNLNIFIWFLNEFKDVPNAHITAGLEHPLLNVAILETTLEQREAMQNTGDSFLSLRD